MLGLLVVAASVSATPLHDRPLSVVGSPSHQMSYKAQLRDAALRGEAFYSLHSICHSATIADVKTQSIVAKPRVLFERVKFTGCGRSALLNLEMRPKGPGTWTAEFRLPGLSYADVQLQQSALSSAIKTVTPHAPKGCGHLAAGANLAIGETSVIGDHGSVRVVLPGQKPRPTAANVRFMTTWTLNDPKLVAEVNQDWAWRELWPLRACGVDRSVSVTFLPHVSQPNFSILVSAHWPGAEGFHTTPDAPH
jgi:hypothetical protein